tara:strand:- start:130 stop:534 length:405 start_codon:yes stop_codon:yes gene_type:complete
VLHRKRLRSTDCGHRRASKYRDVIYAERRNGLCGWANHFNRNAVDEHPHRQFQYDLWRYINRGVGRVSLSGGRGNMRNLIVGALLIGVLVNGMTIMDIHYTIQNVIKSLILLFAIVADSIINPRDEQTGQQGDI